jgi:hypothetical protein
MRPAVVTVLALLTLAAVPTGAAKPRTATYSVSFMGTAHYTLDESQELGCQAHVTETTDFDWATFWDSRVRVPLQGDLRSFSVHAPDPLGELDLAYRATTPPCGDTPGGVMSCKATHYRFKHPKEEDLRPLLHGRVKRNGDLELSVEAVGEPPIADPVTGSSICADEQPVFYRLFVLASKQIPYYLTAEQTVTAKQLRAIDPGKSKLFKVKIEHVPDRDCVGPHHPICDHRLRWSGTLEIFREKG